MPKHIFLILIGGVILAAAFTVAIAMSFRIPLIALISIGLILALGIRLLNMKS
jgi:hypothetical protein